MALTVVRLAPPLDDDVTADLVRVRRAVDAQLNPDDPPVGASELIPDMFVERPEQRSSVWLAHDGDRAVGVVVAGVNVEGENVGYAEVEIDVDPTDAGTGVEDELVRAVLPWLEEGGARTLAWWPVDDEGRAAATRLGMTFRQQERCSRMRVAEVDEAQQGEWIAAPRARAAGYRVVTWTGRCPDDLVEAYATAYSAMADAPIDDIDWTPHGYTVAQVRASEEVAERCGRRIHAALALDAEGAAAGMTRIDVHPDRPQLGQQEDTAVVPAHRGFGLGRWLKAENLRRVRSAFPQLAVVETFNAESNPWMLDINVAMGFRPHLSYSAHQGDLTAVVAALA